MTGYLPWLLRSAVGGIYVFAGICKVFPFSEDMAKENLKEFTAFAKVYPTTSLGYQPDPHIYQVSLGALEVVLGMGLLFGSQVLQKICCGGLILLMVGGVQTMLCLGRKGMALIPLVFIGALGYIWMSLGSTEDGKKEQ